MKSAMFLVGCVVDREPRTCAGPFDNAEMLAHLKFIGLVIVRPVLFTKIVLKFKLLRP